MGVELPVTRPRRLRQNAAVRPLVAETRLHPAEFVLPVFVKEGADEPVPIARMPGVVQHTLESLARRPGRRGAGVGGFMLFGVPDDQGRGRVGRRRPATASSTSPSREVRRGGRRRHSSSWPTCAWTSSPTTGTAASSTTAGGVDNDATLERYAAMAVAQAAPAPTLVGPSGMMDGQVGVVRAALDEAGFTDTIVFAYAAKYASGVLRARSARRSSPPWSGDRATYQQDPANVVEALREIQLDLDEGADIVMVKPALPNLDVVRERRPTTRRCPWRPTRSAASTR